MVANRSYKTLLNCKYNVNIGKKGLTYLDFVFRRDLRCPPFQKAWRHWEIYRKCSAGNQQTAQNKTKQEKKSRWRGMKWKWEMLLFCFDWLVKSKKSFWRYLLQHIELNWIEFILNRFALNQYILQNTMHYVYIINVTYKL